MKWIQKTIRLKQQQEVSEESFLLSWFVGRCGTILSV
tara:strand:+ start:6398 stop:6508 length:111 start_codon:yes stop_codon:yes gene_type:complete